MRHEGRLGRPPGGFLSTMLKDLRQSRHLTPSSSSYWGAQDWRFQCLVTDIKTEEGPWIREVFPGELGNFSHEMVFMLGAQISCGPVCDPA